MNKDLIYSVEDDVAIKDLIAYTVKSEGYEIQSFASAEDMLIECEKRIPNLILLDIMLPGMDGIEALKILRQKYKSANIMVIMLTARQSEISKVIGLDAGADDYVTKPFSVLELMARIRANLRKKTVNLENDDLKVNTISLKQSGRTVSVNGNEIVLTHKEFELLKFLMLNAGIVVEREKILKEIWGFEYFGESRTVDIHIKNLREKLGDERDNIQSVRGIGYILRNLSK